MRLSELLYDVPVTEEDYVAIRRFKYAEEIASFRVDFFRSLWLTTTVVGSTSWVAGKTLNFVVMIPAIPFVVWSLWLYDAGYGERQERLLSYFPAAKERRD